MKLLARDLFGSGHALNSPAHITLIPPFFATAEEIERFSSALENLMAEKEIPEIRLNGFDKFGRRVIFVDVEKNSGLERLQQEIFDLFKQHFPHYRKPNRFHPHVTVAFKDLREDVFDEAWQYFSGDDYFATFRPPGLTILQHRHKRWHKVKDI